MAVVKAIQFNIEEKENKREGKIVDFPFLPVKSDGTPDLRYGSKPERKTTEGVCINKTMKCLYTKEEILLVYNVFKSRVDNAPTPSKEKVARRNLCMFVAGINIGLRSSDLCQLKWNNLFDTDWKLINKPLFKPQKTKAKVDNRVKLTWGNDFVTAIYEYLEWIKYTISQPDLGDYIFASQKGVYIHPKEWWKIMEETRMAAGIDHKIGTHGLRKTMVHSYIVNSQDRYDGLVDMNEELKHSDLNITKRYACTDEDKIQMGKQKSDCIFS